MEITLQKVRAIILSAALLLAIHALQAQNYLINESFNNFPNNLNGTSSNGWTAVTISGDSAIDRWQFNNSIGYDIPPPLTGKVALADAYMGGYTNTGSNNTNVQDLALISPTINTVGLSNLTLTYDELYMQLSASTIYVEVSTDGGTTYTTLLTTATGAFFSASRTINLDSYVGFTSLKIRYRWTKPGTITHGYWMLDNIKVFSRYANDVGVQTLVDPKNNSCPNPTQNLTLRVTNFGTSAANNISVNMGVTGGTTGNFSTTISSLGAGASVNVFTANTINTTAGGNFNFTAYTTMAGDQTIANDTLITTIVTAPTPTDPSGTTVTRCGVGPVTLAANALAGEQTVWYNDSTTTASLGSGNPYQYPNTVYASRRFFAENTRNLPASFSTGLTGVYRYNTTTTKAMFFDVTATNEIVIDSFASNFAYSGRYICSVYYKTGSYFGNVLNQGAFTLLRIDTVDAVVLGQPAYINLGSAKFRVGVGQIFGFAVTARPAPGSANPIPAFAFKLGATNNLSNADIVVYAADVSETAFTNSLNGYSADIQVFYQKVCKSVRKGIDVVIIPRPTGVEFLKGTPNNGLYRSGTQGDPDVARLNDTVSYELQPPTGFSNANFGTSWMITDLRIRTAGGTAPNSSDTMTSFPGANNGRLRFIPRSGVDSVYILQVTILNTITMCDTTVMRYILIGADPKAKFSTAASCEGDVTTFANQSSIATGFLTFKWFFGDGDSSDSPAPNHTYAQAGIYNVRLIATSNYGFQSIFDSTIQVYEVPIADFSVANVCLGSNHQFADASYIPSIGTPVYTWDFADGGAASNSANPTRTYTIPGTYLVSLTVNVNGCMDEKQRYVTLAPRAIPNFSAITSCNDRVVDFSNSSSLSFGTFGSRWNFGDGTTSTSPNPEHNYAAFGNVNVTLIITTDLGCVDSVTKSLSLIESPRADFSLASVCTEEAIQVNNLTSTPSSGTNGYQWNFGNGVTSLSANPTITYNAPGTYKINLIATSTNGCSDSISRTIVIDAKPIADFVASDVCDGDLVSFDNNTINIPGGVAYAWEFGDGRFSTAKDTSLLYAGVGSYTVKLFTRTPNGCMDTATAVVNVNAVPSAAFTFVSAQQGNGTMLFQGPLGSGLSYQWFLGDGGKSTVQSFTYTYIASGNYPVKLIVTTDKGCSSNTTQTVSVTPTSLQGIEQQLAVYPNPSYGSVQVDLSAVDVQAAVLVVRDMHGKELQRIQTQTGQIVDLDLSRYATGTYLVEINGSQGLNFRTKITLLN